MNIQLISKENDYVVDLLDLPVQKRKELHNIENALSHNNPNIFELISNHTIGNKHNV